MRHIEAADGTELWYWVRRRDDGPAPAVLLIHGAASNHTRWSEFTRRTTLTKHYDLVRPLPTASPLDRTPGARR